MATITTVKDIGYRVLTTNEDQSPKQVLRCFIKEGEYGRFISMEKHWVQEIHGDEIETRWARWSITLPYEKEGALKLTEYMKELIEETIESEFSGE
ncbi:MAG: hypothetical protein SVY15_03200 [Halobacteriota archaeon]|nr:hypothetical protein [Halobacteriota archaeon]